MFTLCYRSSRAETTPKSLMGVEVGIFCFDDCKSQMICKQFSIALTTVLNFEHCNKQIWIMPQSWLNPHKFRFGCFCSIQSQGVLQQKVFPLEAGHHLRQSPESSDTSLGLDELPPSTEGPFTPESGTTGQATSHPLLCEGSHSFAPCYLISCWAMSLKIKMSLTEMVKTRGTFVLFYLI